MLLFTIQCMYYIKVYCGRYPETSCSTHSICVWMMNTFPGSVMQVKPCRGCIRNRDHGSYACVLLKPDYKNSTETSLGDLNSRVIATLRYVDPQTIMAGTFFSDEVPKPKTIKTRNLIPAVEGAVSTSQDSENPGTSPGIFYRYSSCW